MIFAFARDGGLPGSALWSRVSPRYRTPVAAIWLTAVLSVAATLYSPAFAALAAGCALFLYVSYAMPVAAGLLAEGKTWTDVRPVPPRRLVQAVRGHHGARRAGPDVCSASSRRTTS